MQGTVSKLQTIGMLIGLVSTIGAGFYAYGVFNNRLDVVENKQFVINQEVDLTDVHDRIAEVKDLTLTGKAEVNTLITTGDAEAKELITTGNKELRKLIDTGDAINAEAIRSLSVVLETIKKDIAINAAAIEYLDAKINEIKAEMSNPMM
jgi:hypothetical protein|tara:strand:- start:1156 stop:1605 length:450 start_codon:yes stop_codon:yes gene_type:complete